MNVFDRWLRKKHKLKIGIVLRDLQGHINYSAWSNYSCSLETRVQKEKEREREREREQCNRQNTTYTYMYTTSIHVLNIISLCFIELFFFCD